MKNPFQVVKDFEEALAEYTGAPYVVTTESCTSALLLCCAYHSVTQVTIPSNTYPSVPCSIIHAGGSVVFDETKNRWSGVYKLEPYNIWDSAKRLTSNMYIPGSEMCLSFHGKKLLPIGRGGAILTDDVAAATWFKQARFDGRHEVPLAEDKIDMVGYNCYLTPEQAARGLLLLSFLPKHNDDMPFEQYPNLREAGIYEARNRNTR